MPVLIRDFRQDDFETLWRIDQQCFSPGISYSRPELISYIRLPGSFTLVAQAEAMGSTREDAPATLSRTDLQAQALDGGGQSRNVFIRQETNRERVGEILGFVVAKVSGGTLGHIITIDVLPQTRRFGIGSALLSQAEERLRAASCTAVRLETAVNNTAALAFYKRHDYSLAKILPRYYAEGLDAFLMSKRLR